MKRYVDGVEVDVEGSPTPISRGADRLYVHTSDGTFTAVAVRQGDKTLVSFKGRQYVVERKLHRVRSSGADASGELRAPMPGLIVDVLVSEGDAVKKGAKLLVLEAMKTQQPLTAPFDGAVTKLSAQKGQQVAEGVVLAIVKPEA